MQSRLKRLTFLRNINSIEDFYAQFLETYRDKLFFSNNKTNVEIQPYLFKGASDNKEDPEASMSSLAGFIKSVQSLPEYNVDWWSKDNGVFNRVSKIFWE